VLTGNLERGCGVTAFLVLFMSSNCAFICLILWFYCYLFGIFCLEHLLVIAVTGVV
jgi:hypothetical protein